MINEPIAVLPAQILYVASLFASQDEAKLVLNSVHVYNTEEGIAVESTDGHRAFRTVLPSFPDWVLNQDKIQIEAKPLRKRIAQARLAVVKANVIEFHGGRKETALIEARPWKAVEGTYPNIPQLWPSREPVLEGGKVAFNARYVSEFMTEVTRFSHNGTVKIEFFGSGRTPAVFSSSMEYSGLGPNPTHVSIDMSYLLMPVQLRDF